MRVRFGETTMYTTITNDGYPEEDPSCQETTRGYFDDGAQYRNHGGVTSTEAKDSPSHARAANFIRNVTNHSPAKESPLRPRLPKVSRHPSHTSDQSAGAHPQTHIVVNVGSPPKAGDKLRPSRVLFENSDVNVRENVMERDMTANTTSADEEEAEIPLMCSVPEHHALEDQLGWLDCESGDSQDKNKENVRRRVHSARIRKEHRYGNQASFSS